ncbi:MAG TPA: hypothetical protein VL172_09120 [Kofleriaceae bacterium]|nr:hypothetical protein [Kofleriaceae bacterium]
MGVRLLVVLVALALLRRSAAADGVCVAVDVDRDNLTEPERNATRIALLDALAREGVAVDASGTRCVQVVRLYSIRLGARVTTTVVAGGKTVSGRAANLDEVDLLLDQLARSLVSGRSLATGTGVTTRTNVLRDQAAPRRGEVQLGRDWDPVLVMGGGMLQLPAANGRPRQRQYSIVALEGRLWGFSGGNTTAMELVGRVLLHDYDVFETATDAYDRVDSKEHPDEALGRAFGVMFSPFGVANWEGGIGMVHFLGTLPPRLYVRAGFSSALLCRFSDPDFYFDVGLGGYAGVGLQLSRHVGLGGAVTLYNPLVHDATGSGYWYLMTTTVHLEIHGDRKTN